MVTTIFKSASVDIYNLQVERRSTWANDTPLVVEGQAGASDAFKLFLTAAETRELARKLNAAVGIIELIPVKESP